MASVTESDRARARHHLGYLQVSAAATYSLGVPAAMQTQFMIEGAFEKLLDSAMPKFVSLLDQLDCIECELFSGADTATVESIGEITINRKRISELGRYYSIARNALANLMGIVPNPFDQRNDWFRANGINVSVSG